MRSLLFIPGDDEKKLAKGVGCGADALILDLEDSVSAPRKAAARAIAAQYISATRALEKRPLLYVRINALDTPHWEADLAGVMGSRPDGVLLPKARSGGDVHTLSIALNHAEERAGTPKGATRIVALTTEVPISHLTGERRLLRLGGLLGRALLAGLGRSWLGCALRWQAPPPTLISLPKSGLQSAARSATRVASANAAAILAPLALVAPVTSGKRAATVGQYASLCPRTTTTPKQRESYRNGAMDHSMTVRP